MVCEYNSKIYSQLCPWLLTWPDYDDDDYEEDKGGYNDAGAN
jgi:hypothetical protein